MCKLSWNVVPMYIKACIAHFWHLPSLGPGRSLPKGNQWEYWDPGLGLNVVGLPVHLPPPNSPWCPYTLMALSPYIPATPIPLTPPTSWCPYTPLPPTGPPEPLPPPNTPWHPLLAPWQLVHALTPYWLLSPTPPATLIPLATPTCPTAPWASTPLFPLIPFWSLHPLLAPDTPLPPASPLDPSHPCLPPLTDPHQNF